MKNDNGEWVIEESKPPSPEEELAEAQAWGFETTQEYYEWVEEMNQEFMKEYEEMEREWREISEREERINDPRKES